MGLPGSGKTTLAKALQGLLKNCEWLNADAIRQQFNDWDFSKTGRIRQSIRMANLANESKLKHVISDFVAPLPEMRDNFNADLVIWMDTIKSGRFEDTNNMFVPPKNYHFKINELNCNKWAIIIAEYVTKAENNLI